MSIFRNLFGPPEVKLEAGQPAPPPEPPQPLSAAETASVRQIVQRLDALPPEQARLVAATAYVVTRAAYADMEITPEETAYLEKALQEHAGLDEGQAVLVVQLAKFQELTAGETEDYVVTREFRKVSTPEQRLAVLRACFLVAAADDTITAEESAVVNQIANELDIPEDQLRAMRAEFTDKFSAIQAARRAAGVSPATS